MSSTRRQWQAAPLVLLFFSSALEAQYCSLRHNTNAYDQPNVAGPGGCAALISSGLTCATHFAIGQTHAGYCNFACHINAFDFLFSQPGRCDTYIASGATCCTNFAPGRSAAGFCDFACHLCPNPAPSPAPPPGSCTTTNRYEDYGALQCPGECQNLIVSGVATCAETFAEGGSRAGQCNLVCGYNTADTSTEIVERCDDLIQSGDSCTEVFDVGQAKDGDCDLSCGFCGGGIQDKMGLLNFRAGEQLDLTSGSHPWTDFGADPSDELTSWTQGSMPCLIGWGSALEGWVGATCDQVNGRVIQLVLPTRGVGGDISYLNKLTALEHLDLHDSTGISGDVGGLASLTALITLDLSRCEQISGSISVLSALSQLVTLKLPGTSVEGDIQSLNGLSTLTTLDITGTQIMGTVLGVQALAGMHEGSSFSPCSLHPCSRGYQLKPTPSNLAGTSTLACCDPLAPCGEMDCGAGYTQDSTEFCADVTCDAADFNLCCERRHCPSPEGSAAAAFGYIVENPLATTVEGLGAVTCAETHLMASNPSVHCNTGQSFEFSGCELPPPLESNVSVDNSSGLVVMAVVALLLAACLIAYHFVMRRSARISIIDARKAEEELHRPASMANPDEDDNDTDPASAKFRRRVRRMSIDLMDEHADERVEEQQKLDAAAAEKKSRLAARLELKRKLLEAKKHQVQTGAAELGEDSTPSEQSLEAKHLDTTAAAADENFEKAGHEDQNNPDEVAAAFVGAETETDGIPPPPPPSQGPRSTRRRRSFGHQDVDVPAEELLVPSLPLNPPPPPAHPPVSGRRRAPDNGGSETHGLLSAVPSQIPPQPTHS